MRAQILKNLLDKSHELQTPQLAKLTKLFDLNKFTEVRTELEYFITQFQLKLQINVNHYSINYVKLKYAISQLNEIVLKQILHFKVTFTDIKARVDAC